MNTNFLESLSEVAKLPPEELLSYYSPAGVLQLAELQKKNNQFTETKYLKFLSKHLGLQYDPTLEKKSTDILQKFTKIIPYHKALDFLAIPYKQEKDKLYIAVSEPVNENLYQWIGECFEKEIVLSIAPVGAIQETLNTIYERAGTTEEALETLDKEQELLELGGVNLEEITELLDSRNEEPVIRLVNSLIFQAVKRGASDIHIDPERGESIVRIRIHGDLQEVAKFPKYGHNPTVNRLKVMSNLDISTKSKSQDGRIAIRLGGEKIDIRLSILPTMHGERVVLRILENKVGTLNLESLGLDKKMQKNILRLINQPHGIILLTGPTGSGKTTTLYACLAELDSNERNIITIEDPVEYQLEGLGQVQVNEKIGLTFASGLRSILRQDPDVIMVGEIRDEETAEIAVQSSLTGHLVLSTLHTNDSASTIARLVDMGVEPFLIASTFSAAIAKRLIRTICPDCKKGYKISKEELLKEGFPKHLLKDFSGELYEGKGCKKCYQAGYSGRDGVYEVLNNSPAIRQAISQNLYTEKIKQIAVKEGMKTLSHHCAEKVLAGTTTLQEWIRLVLVDEKEA
jgi:general secretion pathway protein E